VGSLAVLLVPVRPPLGLWVVNGVLLVAAVCDWLLAVRPGELEGGGGVAVVSGVLRVAAVCDCLLAVRPGELEVERELPGIVPLGAEARVVWRVAHRGS